MALFKPILTDITYSDDLVKILPKTNVKLYLLDIRHYSPSSNVMLKDGSKLDLILEVNDNYDHRFVIFITRKEGKIDVGSNKLTRVICSKEKDTEIESIIIRTVYPHIHYLINLKGYSHIILVNVEDDQILLNTQIEKDSYKLI